MGAQRHRIDGCFYTTLFKAPVYERGAPSITLSEFYGLQVGFHLLAIVMAGSFTDTYLRGIGFNYTRLRYTTKMATTKKQNKNNDTHIF